MAVPFRILIVDNESSITLSLKFVFAGPRYEVLCVDSGPAALALLDGNSNPFDVIIVDQKMPNLTGVELVEAIRQRGIPGEIIVLSAHLTPEARDAYERLNVHAIFPKPFDLEKLRSVVAHLADSNQPPTLPAGAARPELASVKPGGMAPRY
jgi:CheY-like chemotaxis protein